MVDLTDLEFAGLLFVGILAVLGVDTIAKARQERRWAERRQELRVRAELRRSTEDSTGGSTVDEAVPVVWVRPSSLRKGRADGPRRLRNWTQRRRTLGLVLPFPTLPPGVVESGAPGMVGLDRQPVIPGEVSIVVEQGGGHA